MQDLYWLAAVAAAATDDCIVKSFEAEAAVLCRRSVSL
jgi:hypothetical protein